MRRKLLATARALGVLGAVWGALTLVGWGAGAFPRHGPEPAGEPDAGVGEPDAGVVADAAAHLDAGPPPDAALPDAGPPLQPPRWRAVVCPGADTSLPGATAAVEVGDVVGDARPEIVVACGGEVHVVGLAEESPLRVAQVDGLPGRAMRPRIGRFAGGDRPDLVVGHAAVDAAGNPTGGSLRWFRGLANGALAEPERLVDAPVVAASLFEGARPGLVAVTWPDAHGVRPSELWIFDGGPSPHRVARVRIGLDGGDVAALDLDGDGRVDLVTVDGEHLRRFDASGTPAEVWPVDGGRRLLVVGRGEKAELWVAGDALTRLEEGTLQPVEAPPGVRSMVALDVDHDGREDVVVATRDAVVALVRGADGSVRSTPLVALPAGLWPHDLAVHDGGLVLVVASRLGWELLSLAPAPSAVPDAAPPPLGDAPLVLRWASAL